ncbi:hypothetical protein CA830_28975, partial [Burkholderia multivorans]
MDAARPRGQRRIARRFGDRRERARLAHARLRDAHIRVRLQRVLDMSGKRGILPLRPPVREVGLRAVRRRHLLERGGNVALRRHVDLHDRRAGGEHRRRDRGGHGGALSPARRTPRRAIRHTARI